MFKYFFKNIFPKIVSLKIFLAYFCILYFCSEIFLLRHFYFFLRLCYSQNQIRRNLKCFCQYVSRISGGFGDFYTMKRSQDNLSEAYLAQILKFLEDDQLRAHDYY